MTGTSIVCLSDPDLIVESLGSFRRQILGLLEEPDSATGLAKRLGTTRQRVNYHLHVLVGAGLVELAEVRQRRGLHEQVMRRSAEIVLVDPSAFSTRALRRKDATGLTAVVSLAGDQVRHAAEVAAAAGASDERVVAATLDTTIRVKNPTALRAMIEELAAIVARYDEPDDGLLLRVSTAILPGRPNDVPA